MPSICKAPRYNPLAAAGLLLLMSAGAAIAQPVNPEGGPEIRPYTFIATQRFKQDSNLFRVDGDAAGAKESSDTISATGIGFQMNQLFSRQRLLMDLNATHNLYKNNDRLDNTEYQTMLRWDMVTGGELSGDLRWNGGQKLGDFGDAGGNTGKNLERNRVLSGRLQLGMNSLWSLEAGAAYRKLTFSQEASNALELKATSGNAGIRYNPTDLLSLGLGYRKTSGDYFNTERTFDRDDIDLTARVAPNAISSFMGRISRTSQTYDAASSNLDSNLITSAIGMQWRPGGSIGFDFQVLRDNNAGIGTGESTLETSTAAQAPVTTTLQSIVRWEITPKILSNLTLRTSKRDLTASVTNEGSGLVTESTGSDRTNYYGVGLDYTPVRWLKFQGSIGQEKRSSQKLQSGAWISTPYNATIGALGAEIRLD